MKYVIIIPDGCADESQTELDGKTPLEAAVTPAMDQIAANGIVGRANHTPAHLPAGSSVANMSLLGYDPIKNYTGRAPLEAAAQGIELGEYDWCIRCNLVTVTEQTMTSFTAGHISSPDAKELLDGLLIRYIESQVYQGVVENKACEQAARMLAMKNATDNAGDMIDELQLLYNKARQAAITQELSEIVSGAAAV